MDDQLLTSQSRISCSSDDLVTIHSSSDDIPKEISEESAKTKKHKSRPTWYDPTMRKHRCVECGWIGMALPNSLHNLKRHFESISRDKECKDKYICWKSEIESLQPPLETVLSGEMKRMSCESQEKIDKLLAKFILASEVPLHLVELPEFRTLLNALNSRYQVPYIPKLKHLLLLPMLKDSNDDLFVRLDKCPYVALTIDGWTSRRKLSMISLVVYYIGENGALRNDLLNIRIFKGSQRMAEFTQVAVQEWKLKTRIRIGPDNAANMKKAFDTVLEYEHDPLDIEINDEEELEEIDELILTDASVSIF